MHGQIEMLIILSTVSQPCKLDNYSGIRFLEFNFVDTLVQPTYENPRKKELNNILWQHIMEGNSWTFSVLI